MDHHAARLRGHLLEPFAAYVQLLSRLKDASPEEVRDFLRRYGDSSVSDRLRGDWLKILGANREWALFSAEYPLLENRTTELGCYSLQARLDQGETQALDEAKRLWFTGAELPASCTPLFDALAADGRLTEQDVWQRVRLALESDNLSVAKTAAAYLPPSHRLPERALKQAADNALKFLEKRPVDLHSRAGRELTMFALCRVARGQPRQALPYWQSVQKHFSPGEQGYLWGRLALYAARKHDPVALSWFARAGSTALDDVQLAWKARAALREQLWGEVLAAIEAMSGEEKNLGVWRYWKARALAAQGRTVEANRILAVLSRESHYYGQLANEELGAVAGAPAEVYRPGEDEIRAVQERPAIRRALALYDLGMRYDASREWAWAIRGFDDRRLLAAAELARRHEWYDRAIHTAEKTVALHNFDLRFPAPHRDVMLDYTRRLDLDEAWVYGLIRQESRFVQQARSSAGASGLMQLMPATARWVAKRMGLRDFRQSAVNDLNTNVALGTYYLKHVLSELDNQTLLATAAYNAGPRRARDWRGPAPMEGAVYAETIPFSETRSYVQKVLSNAAYYAQRFGNQLSSLKTRLGTIMGRPPQEGREPDGRDE
jgi:soluble lytic murein transglycosylase